MMMTNEQPRLLRHSAIEKRCAVDSTVDSTQGVLGRLLMILLAKKEKTTYDLRSTVSSVVVPFRVWVIWYDHVSKVGVAAAVQEKRGVKTGPLPLFFFLLHGCFYCTSIL
jgi:selenophosphate synthetase-related protein